MIVSTLSYLHRLITQNTDTCVCLLKYVISYLLNKRVLKLKSKRFVVVNGKKFLKLEKTRFRRKYFETRAFCDVLKRVSNVSPNT